MSPIFFLTDRQVKQNITSMETYRNSVHSLCLWGLEPREKKFLNAYLEWRGIQVIKAHSSASLAQLEKEKDEKSELACLVWDQPVEERISELLDSDRELLFIGRSSEDLRKTWIGWGIARYFSGMETLHTLPVFYKSVTPNPSAQAVVFWIYTGHIWMDRILRTMLRSFGHRVILPLEAGHLFHHLDSEKPDIVILDWDSVRGEDKNFFQNLENYSLTKNLPLFLGLKDFNKQGLSQDLTKWISKFSTLTFPRERIAGALLFGLKPKTKEPNNFRRKESILWDKLGRGQVQSVSYDWENYPTPIRAPEDLTENWRWFEWLLDENLFH